MQITKQTLESILLYKNTHIAMFNGPIYFVSYYYAYFIIMPYNTATLLEFLLSMFFIGFLLYEIMSPKVSGMIKGLHIFLLINVALLVLTGGTRANTMERILNDNKFTTIKKVEFAQGSYKNIIDINPKDENSKIYKIAAGSEVIIKKYEGNVLRIKNGKGRGYENIGYMKEDGVYYSMQGKVFNNVKGSFQTEELYNLFGETKTMLIEYDNLVEFLYINHIQLPDSVAESLPYKGFVWYISILFMLAFVTGLWGRTLFIGKDYGEDGMFSIIDERK